MERLPTSAPTNREVKTFFQIVSPVRSTGVSFILVTHKLEEIYEICDEVTVIRNGEVVNHGPIADFMTARLSEAISGRQIPIERLQPPDPPRKQSITEHQSPDSGHDRPPEKRTRTKDEDELGYGAKQIPNLGMGGEKSNLYLISRQLLVNSNAWRRKTDVVRRPRALAASSNPGGRSFREGDLGY